MAQILSERGKKNKIAYINKYQKRTYKAISLKCRIGEDQDIFDILNSKPKVSKNDYIKKAIRYYAANVED